MSLVQPIGRLCDELVANGKVTRNSPFRNVYVQSAAGDAGGAIGSAMITAREVGIWFDQRMSIMLILPVWRQ